MSYTRVIPRDLFNEADLLKCYGRLYILLETGAHTAELSNEGQGRYEPFEITQDESGDLTIENVSFTIRGEPWRLWRPLNARNPWPLKCSSFEDEDITERVFTDDGKLSLEFLMLISV